MPLHIKSPGDIRTLGKPENPPLGISEDASYTSNVETISTGSGLLIVTDGITEAKSPNGELFGADRLLEAAKSTESYFSQEIMQKVNEQVADFCQSIPQQDDITLFVLMNRTNITQNS